MNVNEQTTKSTTYHQFVPPEQVAGKQTPDRCAVCGNARGTIYHDNARALLDKVQK